MVTLATAFCFFHIAKQCIHLGNRQLSIGGTDFGEMRIERVGPGGVNVYIGGDDSRQSNKLKLSRSSSLKPLSNAFVAPKIV